MPALHHTLLSRISTLAQRLRLPQQCLICDTALPVTAARLCRDCEQSLPWLAPGCECCALRDSALAPGQRICDRCLAQPPAYDRCLALFDYQRPVSVLIGRFKYRQALAEGSALAQLLCANFRRFYAEAGEALPDCLLPVPLHHWRLRRRGFNQAVELARPLSRMTGITLDLHSIQRREHRPAQQGQSRQQRRRSTEQLFQPAPHHQLERHRHIAIIDDVVTTGATANALANTLRQATTARIDLWCLARVGIDS